MKNGLLIFRPVPRDMSEEEYMQSFGGVYEESPWIAAESWRSGIDETLDTVDGVAGAFAATVDNADIEAKRRLINAHPDLAGRAAIRGELTAESTAEQAGAGISECSAEEFAEFQDFNARYRKKFGFPFIMAVKGSNRQKILAAFRERLGNEPAMEFDRALAEIHKIARWRLEEIARSGQAAAAVQVRREN